MPQHNLFSFFLFCITLYHIAFGIYKTISIINKGRDVKVDTKLMQTIIFTIFLLSMVVMFCYLLVRTYIYYSWVFALETLGERS